MQYVLLVVTSSPYFVANWSHPTLAQDRHSVHFFPTADSVTSGHSLESAVREVLPPRKWTTAIVQAPPTPERPRETCTAHHCLHCNKTGLGQLTWIPTKLESSFAKWHSPSAKSTLYSALHGHWVCTSQSPAPMLPGSGCCWYICLTD